LEWINAIETTLGKTLSVAPTEEEPPAEKVLVIEPQIIQALPSPDCKTDFNYNFHGKNWVCNCNQGLE